MLTVIKREVDADVDARGLREIGGETLRATPSDGVNFIPYIKLLGVE
jgi:hypothetical protein